MRRSTRTGWAAPTGWTSFSCRTRSSFDLQRGGQLPDLVEQHRSAARGPEETGPVLDRAGVRATPHPEQLALRQLLGKRAAVHRHERPGAPGPGMQRPGGELLPGAGLALEHHRHARRSDPGQRRPAGEQIGVVALASEVGGPGREHRRRLVARVLVEHQEGLPALDGVAGAEHRAALGRVLHAHPVLAASILDDPPAQDPPQAGVEGGHPVVGEAEADHALGRLGGRASQPHLVGAGQVDRRGGSSGRSQASATTSWLERAGREDGRPSRLGPRGSGTRHVRSRSRSAPGSCPLARASAEPDSSR